MWRRPPAIDRKAAPQVPLGPKYRPPHCGRHYPESLAHVLIGLTFRYQNSGLAKRIDTQDGLLTSPWSVGEDSDGAVGARSDVGPDDRPDDLRSDQSRGRRGQPSQDGLEEDGRIGRRRVEDVQLLQRPLG